MLFLQRVRSLPYSTSSASLHSGPVTRPIAWCEAALETRVAATQRLGHQCTGPAHILYPSRPPRRPAHSRSSNHAGRHLWYIPPPPPRRVTLTLPTTSRQCADGGGGVRDASEPRRHSAESCGWYKRVRCRRSLQRGTIQDSATSIPSDALLWPPHVADT